MSTDYRKLFGQKHIILTNTDRETLGSEIESVDYMTEYFNKKQKFVPPVDFSNPKNFARFGSAEKYYIDAIDRIYKTYPYDGSLKERVQWELSSSYLDLHIFENEYPRTNGYVILSADGWGTQTDTESGYGATATSSYEYIFTKGGPNTSLRSKEKDILDVSGDYRSGYANVWDVSKNRESNLKLGGVDGSTVEFWLKKSEFLGASLTNQEVLFDAYTSNHDSSSVNYGRLTVEMTAAASGSPFRITYMSGTSGFSYETIGSGIDTSSVADDSWHHYAFTFKNTGSAIEANLFIDGACSETVVTGSSIDYVSGNINATIGALALSPSGTIDRTMLGWGKLSGSLDEFRFWKTARSSQKIGRQYIEPVGGGTNTDDANTALGIYYKFNEGITQTSSIDETVLDYSGRISNGTFVGYNSSARNVGSAMVSSSLVDREFKDPILYSTHPDVVSYRDTKTREGKTYDFSNNSSIYFTLPAWITEEVENIEYSPLRNLTQIIGSYFDSLGSQIESISQFKHKNYLSSSFKPYPFSDRLLQSVGFSYFPELFSDATALEQFRNRDDKLLFKQKLYDVKNRIYQNIYNNIVYIYKTKGTEKSFRNLIRCFGLDDEIYKINLYGNRVTYQLKDNYSSVAEFKKYVNFALTGTQQATAFPVSSSSNPNSTSFISGSGAEALENYLAFTMETEVAFPRRHSLADVNTVVKSDDGVSRAYRTYIPFKSASLFGVHQVSGTIENDLTWVSDDYANFQVHAIREDTHSKRCLFQLTGSSTSAMPTLTSSYFSEVFDDTRWTFSVSIRPSIYSLANFPTGTSGTVDADGYMVEFYGVEKVLDSIKNEFFLTSSITAESGKRFLTNPKSVYIGAHLENFSGTLQQKADGNISSTRVWLSHLATGTIQQHAQDAKNYGTPSPYKSAYLYQSSMTGTRVPEIHTLALNWTFDDLTGSNASGEFIGQDFSSGSTSLQGRYNWIGDITGKQYLPKGINFPADFSSTINRKYVYSAKKQLPEFINSSDMVNVLSDDDIFFNKVDLVRPTNYYMYIEKSMYQTISEEMIRMFSSIKDFNNLIGEPVNKYRSKYKHMEKLRELFFERVGNTPDLDKYIDFYKWVDQTLDVLLGYLVPASADISDQYGSNIRTLIESHVLERSKYKWQFPTLEDKTSDPEGNILGINELLYDWEYGHAPIGTDYNAIFASARSIAFNGVTGESQLTVSDADSLSFGATGLVGGEPSFSFSAWIKPTDLSSGFWTILGKTDVGGTASEYRLYINASDDKLRLQIYDENSANYIVRTSDDTISTDTWTHVCATYDSTRVNGGIILYINGALASSTGADSSYTAMHNTNTTFAIGRLYSDATSYVSEGYIDEVAAFNKNLVLPEVQELYNSARIFDLSTFSAAGNLVSWWRMGDKATGTSPNYTIPDQIGSNDATMSSFQGDSTSGVVPETVQNSAIEARANNCLWWNQRAPRDSASITSYDVDIDSNRQTMLDSINNETNAKDYMLYDSATSTTYSGSTYVTRRLAKPYKFKVDESRTIKGGTNFHPNKQSDIFRTEIEKQSPGGGSGLFVPTEDASGYIPNIESFKDCDDDKNLVTKRKQPFRAGLLSDYYASNPDGYLFRAKGALFSPFNIYSASISGGYHDIISNNWRSGIDITNLHEDSYGPLYGVPMQSPFTEKYVGGLQNRHIALNTGADIPSTRAEAWWIFTAPATSFSIYSPTAPSSEAPKAMRLRDETAKRPVNIRNIQQTTGSTIIGNYTKDYEIIMTSGRSINNRYFVKNEGISASSVSSQIISGVLDYGLPGATESGIERTQTIKNGLTSSVKNSYIIVNRFSAPGDPSTMCPAFLDIESQEYSVYNSLPWRNLIVRDGLQELLTDHTKQFGYFSDAQNSASYALAGQTYPGTSGSVNVLDYAGSASFHKVNKNPRKVARFDGASTSSYVSGVIYDNWHVQHQIPQSDYQYAWITSSVLRDENGITNNPFLDFEQPNFSNASLASTDITFCSASDYGSYWKSAWGLRIFGGPYAEFASDQFVPTDFAGINSNIYETMTSSLNILGYPLAATTTMGAYPNCCSTPGAFLGANYWPQLLNGLILHRQGPYGWPSWKQTRGGGHPIIRAHRKENIQSFLQQVAYASANEPPKLIDNLISQIEPPITSKFAPLNTI